ncbi:MAG: PD-(D/E)XK nuclease family protein [Myxococcales bacterium]|nr:PD-(D/E)XK nuclease family protein [Myxococcales bacterium]
MTHRSLPIISNTDGPPAGGGPSSVLTPSKIRTFMNCPRRFEFQYVSKVPERATTSAVLFGKAMHAALERFHVALRDNLILLPLDLAPTFANALDGESAKYSTILFRQGETRFSLVAEARRLLELYRNVALRFDIAEVEHRFEVALALGEDVSRAAVLRGKIDLLTKEPGIVEFKTTRRRPSTNAQNFDDNLQLLAYAFAHHATFGVIPAVSFVYFVRGDWPEIITYKATPSVAQFEFFRSLVEDVRSRIDSGLYLPNPGKLCEFCPYQTPCNPVIEAPPPPRAPSMH